MTISTIVRRPLASSYIAALGLPLDVPFQSVRVSTGFDQAVSQAQFQVPYLTSRLALNQPINIDISAQQIGQPGVVTGSFTGYIVGYQPSYYPRGVTVMCEGPLTLAARYKPAAGIDYTGFQTGAAIRAVLEECGIDPSRMVILDTTNPILGLTFIGLIDERFVWRKGQTGLDFILSLDQISKGYRTFDWGGSGIVFRKMISMQPFEDPSLTFTEHVDISGGGGDWSLDMGAQGAEVQGVMGPSGTQIVAGGSRTGLGAGYVRIQNPMIESQAQADDAATYATKELGKPLARMQFTTYRVDDVRPGMTIEVSSINRLMIHRRVWVQNVVREITESGLFQQTVTFLTEIIPDPTDEAPGVPATFGGDLQPSPTGPDVAAAPYDELALPIADFKFEFVDHEFDDLGNEFWIVVVRSTSYAVAGTITTYAWTTDTVTVPDTGAAQLFTTKITSIATAITLTVTDSNAKTQAITKACNGSEALAVTRDRHLYASSGAADAIAYDGAGNWRTQAVSGASTDVVGNGPIWNDGPNIAASIDDLLTAPGSAVAFAAQDVTALWCETDVDANRVYAGGASGGVSVSSDGASTWTEKAGPSANAVLRIIASRYNPGEVLVLDSAGGIYQSLNFGDTWGVIASRAGAVDLAQSNFRNWVGGSFGVEIMETGLLGTWPGATPNIVAIAAHIRDDILYALADDGSTFYTSPAGGLAFVAGASLPSGTAQARGLVRDGAAVDLLYIAAGDRILKSWDGLRTTPCYAVIYHAVAVSVGYGDFPLAFINPASLAVAFLRGSWFAQLGDGTWEERDLGGESSTGGELAWNPSATSTDEAIIIAMDPGTPTTYRRYITADGGMSWTKDVEGTFPANTSNISTLFLGFRGGSYRVLVGQTITAGTPLVGGEYESAAGVSWAATGRAPARIFYPGSVVANPDAYCATSAHAYYLMDTDAAGSAQAVYVDTLGTSTPAVQRLSTVGTVSGGTFTISVNGQTTAPIAWNASAAAVLAALALLSTWGAGGSSSGTLAGDNLDVTFPYNGPQALMSINSGSITGGGSIGIASQTAGTDGRVSLNAATDGVSSSGFFGAIEADVCMISGQSAGSVPRIHKLINTAVTDVSPSGIMAAFDEVFTLVSRDGDTWVGSAFIDANAGNNLIVSHDQGATWAVSDTGGWDASEGVFDIVPDPVTAGVWWVIIGSNAFTGRLYKSTDDGDTFAQLGDTTFIVDGHQIVPIGGISH